MSGTIATQVGVIGGGIMGAGIAEAAARTGCEVTVIDVAADRPLAEPGGRIRQAVGRIRGRRTGIDVNGRIIGGPGHDVHEPLTVA